MSEDIVVDTTSAQAEESILRIVRDVLKRPDIGPRGDAFDYGATSLSLVRILASIKAELGVTIHAPALDGDVTVDNLTRHVVAARTMETKGA